VSALIASLLAWIAAATGYAVPPAPPEVRLVPHEVIKGAMCAGEECAIGAMYQPGRDLIYLDERLEPAANDFDAAVLLHELVHWVQDRSGRFPDRDCRTRVAAEREAYTLQAAWLRERHRRYPLARQLPDEGLCDEPEGGARR
jgi:uncharacterized protein DUF6647